MTIRVLHFLVVDDNDESREMIVEYLKSYGYERITEARDGAEAARQINWDPTINFIISDWDMPLMNGLTLLQLVRANPNRANLPFLIATSPVSDEAAKVVLAAENFVDAYIIKPFRGDALKEKIDQLLSSSVHGPQKQVLVVDDDPDAQAMVIEYLKTFNFKDIYGVRDGRAALDYLTENPGKIGLIVSDWEMPEMTGIELLRACKSQAQLCEIPFLMITSQTSMERMKVLQAGQANVDQYLLKPFTRDDLKIRIDGLLEKARFKKEIQIFITQGSDHLDHGRYQKAADFFEEALRIDPNSDLVLRGLGDALIKIKGVEAALPHYRRAVEMGSSNPKNYMKLTAAFEQIGWIDKALLLLQTGTTEVPDSPDLHFHLGRIYNKKGMFTEAKTEFEKTLEIQLDHQEAALMLGMLGSRTE